MKSSTILLATAALLVGTVTAGAETPTLEVRAGLGGIARPDRWIPVRVTVDNSGPEITGVLVVSWGDSEVRRDIVVPSPSRKQIEVYVRTARVESAVRVRLVSSGVELRVTEAPVRLLSPIEKTTLCVSDGDAAPSGGEQCTVSVAADVLPESPRGYDAFDRAIVSGTTGLRPSQRTALGRWQLLRRLEDAGEPAALSRVTRPVAPRGLPSASRTVLAIGLCFYLAALLMARLMSGAPRLGSVRIYAALAISMVLGSTAALAIGRGGPATAVVVHHSTLLQQLPGSNGSAVTLRALAEFPAFESFALRARLDDAVIEPIGVADKREQAFDEQGEAVLAGRFALGARRAFALEGFTSFELLAVAVKGSTLQVRNRSSVELHDCAFGEGFSLREIGTLRPGQAIEATQQSRPTGAAFACSMDALPFGFSDPSRQVETRGAARLVAYLP